MHHILLWKESQLFCNSKKWPLEILIGATFVSLMSVSYGHQNLWFSCLLQHRSHTASTGSFTISAYCSDHASSHLTPVVGVGYFVISARRYISAVEVGLKTIAHAALQWPLAKKSLLFLVLESNWLYVIE